ncbi:MAG: hemolysin III family protein [bacterium]|nr:hemolysin III family protein [bacterium]
MSGCEEVYPVVPVAVEASSGAEYTAREEWVHAISHGVGFVAAVIGLVVLLAATSQRGTTSDLVGVAIFGITLTLLYAASTLYHGLPESASKNIMRKLDHIAIYLLISGTYTPFILTKMANSRGWVVLGVVWALAVLGIVLELVRNSSTRRTSLALYIVMGWLAVFTVGPLLETLDLAGVVLLILGGLVYSLGIVFYAWRALPYNHAVWHGFVLGGSALHFAAIVGFVVP